MLVIRLTRKGKKNQPFFRVVVTDKRNSSKGGRFVEDLGFVDPLTKKKNLKKERVLHWISKGAKPSDSMHNLLVSEKIIDGKKVHVSKISKKKQAEINKVKDEATAKAKADEAAASVPQGGAPAAETPAPAEPAENPSDNQAGKEPKPAEELKPEEPK